MKVSDSPEISRIHSSKYLLHSKYAHPMQFLCYREHRYLFGCGLPCVQVIFHYSYTAIAISFAWIKIYVERVSSCITWWYHYLGSNVSHKIKYAYKSFLLLASIYYRHAAFAYQTIDTVCMTLYHSSDDVISLTETFCTTGCERAPVVSTAQNVCWWRHCLVCSRKACEYIWTFKCDFFGETPVGLWYSAVSHPSIS